jgi:two-component system chemotaxis response regulator CheY
MKDYNRVSRCSKSTYNVNMKTKIVVVDDAPFIREVVRHLLAGTEIEIVAEAEDGIDAVEKVLHHKPDIVLMDLVMPRLSGIEATQQIKEKLPGVKILACSTLDSETMMMKAIDAGCSQYIIKPFKGSELVEALRDLVRSKEEN